MKCPFFSRGHPTLVLAVIGLVAMPTVGSAAIVSSGNFQTGTPTPTLSITTAFSLTISTTGSLRLLAFDEWVQSDGTQNSLAPSPAGQSFSYQINNGPVQMASVFGLFDNYANTAGALTSNDGYIFFNTAFTVTAGQTLTFLPSNTTFGAQGNTFNPPPPVFTGNVFVTDMNGSRLSPNAPVSGVPEPSAWACILAMAGLLGWRLYQCRHAV